jgi:putative transposase
VRSSSRSKPISLVRRSASAARRPGGLRTLAAQPRIISDNGPQFVARDFREFIRLAGMTHVRTSPYYPQSNGKLERYHRTIKSCCLRPGVPLSLADARRLVEGFVSHYNTVRLHSAIQYITPADKLAGRAEAILAAREAKLAAAREARRARRASARSRQWPAQRGRTSA